MNPSATTTLHRDESPSASDALAADNESMFRQLFERSADAIFLFDPRRLVFVDCNQAAVEMMRATSKQQLLMVHPAELSPEFQPDGQTSREKTPQVINVALRKGTHRFEWHARRMDGTEFPLEVLLTPIQSGEHPLMATMCRDITERKAREAALRESEENFRGLFEASADAISILDPETRKFIACNEAAVRLSGASDKTWVLSQSADGLAPERQPDGRSSREAAQAWVERALAHGTQRFEWVARRFTGEELPMEMLLTPTMHQGNARLIVVARDISERKKAERELLELTQALEQRVNERTAELSASEARFRALVEQAPEAIVVFEGVTGRFLFGNEHACRLYGVPMEKLAELTPAGVSPEFQPGGRRSDDLAREKLAEALAGGMPVFEWIHQQQPSGRLIPTEVRLLRLPAKDQKLIRASIIDNTERKCAERALRESEAKFRALFEGSSQGIVLHDENGLLEVNPAAARILGRENPEELLGKHPSETSPVLQPNGESSAALSQKYIQECMSKGSARFEWWSCDPTGREIPLEVALNRIEWSGRQVIQAFITDIRERQRAQAALAESEARFSAAFNASPIIISIARVSDGRYVLVNDAFVNWSGYARDEILERTAFELGLWEDQGDRDDFWADLRRTGSIREREWKFQNRNGERFIMLVACELIHLNHVPHVLGMAQDITQRKRAEEELLKTLDREKQLSELRSNFVSMVSHEFRTPLGIIQSSAELLGDFYEKMEPTERREQLDSISRNALRMADMMEEVLVLSRLDAGKLDFQPSSIDLNLFCRKVVNEVLSTTGQRCKIELLTRAAPAEARADERLLGHIFTNILSNAVKYSEPGATVAFSVERDGVEAVCVVRDQGIGISHQDQEQLFTAFHRGGNVGSRPGTGLGLLLVKRCTDLHSGKIELQSQIGKGTTVTVRLPVFSTEP